MGLVDYSDSDSESEAVPKPTAQPQPAESSSANKKPSSAIKPFNRSATGKILVNLPSAASTESVRPPDERPIKRARLDAGTGGASRFSNFGSFLPPPKATKPPPAAASQAQKSSAPRPGVHLKTGAEPAFSREPVDDAEVGYGNGEDGLGGSGSRLNLPPPKGLSGPSIPAGQKPAEEVKLVGKPLMFKPLSVGRKQAGKKKKAIPGAASNQQTAAGKGEARTLPATASGEDVKLKEEAPKKKVSLFSMGASSTSANPADDPGRGVYEPLFDGKVESGDQAELEDDGLNGWTDPSIPPLTATYVSSSVGQHSSLSSIADDLNLSAAARRELFGRGGGGGSGTAKIVNFDMEREYTHNEELRAAGEQQAYNPVRSIAPGKHNLRQMVNAVHNNQDALEESFAAGRSNKREAGTRYGWT